MVSAPVVLLNHLLIVAACLIALLFCEGKKLDKTLLFVYNACMIVVPCCGRYVMLQFCLCPTATEGGSCCRSGCGPLDAPLPNMKSVLMAGSSRVT